ITAFKRTLSLSNPHTAACLKSSAFAENSKRWNRFLSIDLRRNLNNRMLEVEGVYVAVMKSYGKKRESPRSSKRLRKDGFLRFLLSLCGNATRSHSGGTEHGTTVKKLQELYNFLSTIPFFFVMCEFAGYSLCEGDLTVIEPNLDYKCVSSDCRKHERY
ncbi:hypothetical protein HID58_047419, partial [Brassica napus]